jgi:phosphoenolpyruvate-protein kinase (PTS system EI component)
VDGPVKHVDPLERTVSVGWLFGLLSTTLEVTEDTRIVVDGRAASLTDIREGAKVNAAYEARDDKRREVDRDDGAETPARG